MTQFHFHAPELQVNLELFLKFRSERYSHMGKFNEDIQTMERLFKSSGVPYVFVNIEDSSELAIGWDDNRIVYHRGSDKKPLAEASFPLRLRAKEQNWLQELLEAALDDMRQMRDEAGGPIWTESNDTESAAAKAEKECEQLVEQINEICQGEYSVVLDGGRSHLLRGKHQVNKNMNPACLRNFLAGYLAGVTHAKD